MIAKESYLIHFAKWFDRNNSRESAGRRNWRSKASWIHLRWRGAQQQATKSGMCVFPRTLLEKEAVYAVRRRTVSDGLRPSWSRSQENCATHVHIGCALGIHRRRAFGARNERHSTLAGRRVEIQTLSACIVAPPKRRGPSDSIRCSGSLRTYLWQAQCTHLGMEAVGRSCAWVARSPSQRGFLGWMLPGSEIGQKRTRTLFPVSVGDGNRHHLDQ